jgi:hypothetical protein
MKKFKINLSVLAAAALVTGAANAYDLNLGKDQTISFHGFLSQGCLVSDDYNYLGRTADGGSFQFTEIGLNASYSPFERTRIAVQGFAFDVGDIGDLEPFLDYASLEYTFSDCIGLRGGRVRRPGGLYNHIQDVDLARTSVLLPQGMYDARWRDFSTSVDGGVAFGNLQMDKAGSLSYEAFAGMMNVSMDGGVASLLKQSLPPGANLDDIPQSPIAGAQLWWNTPISGLRAGAMLGQVFNFGYEVTAVSPFVGVINLDTEGDIFVQQYSLEYLWKAWTFQAEYYTYNYRNHTVQQNTVLGTSVVSTNGSKSVPTTRSFTTTFMIVTAPAWLHHRTRSKKMWRCRSASILWIGGSSNWKAITFEAPRCCGTMAATRSVTMTAGGCSAPKPPSASNPCPLQRGIFL